MKRRAFLGTAIGSLIAGAGLAQATTAPSPTPEPLAASAVAPPIPDVIVESVVGATSQPVIEPAMGTYKLIRQPDGACVIYLFAYYHTEIEYTVSYSPDAEDTLQCMQWHFSRTWFRVGSQLYYGHLERQNSSLGIPAQLIDTTISAPKHLTVAPL